MSDGRRETRRVLIALGGSSARVPGLEMCRHLLGAPAELLGLFVEDPRLLAHARSRLAREVVMSGLERKLDPTALERQLRARSAMARRVFETAAAELGLEHAFEVVRGEPLAELTQAAQRADAVVVDAAAGAGLDVATPEMLRLLALLPFRMLLFARDEPGAGTDVVVVAKTAEHLSTAPGTALDAGAGIARRLGARLAIIVLGEAAAPAAAHLAEAGRVAGVDVRAQIAMGGAAPSAAAVAAQARTARLLVLAADEAASPDLVAALVVATRSSLLLVRSPSAAPAPREPAEDAAE